jgi:hypothetical protein
MAAALRVVPAVLEAVRTEPGNPIAGTPRALAASSF